HRSEQDARTTVVVASLERIAIAYLFPIFTTSVEQAYSLFCTTVVYLF
ncbi:MAG: hypothetical protein F6K47_30265, partial [Symploca sp. SIO2E6]|nr:hypothetical protein [Symploca sp. SIO2E6]